MPMDGAIIYGPGIVQRSLSLSRASINDYIGPGPYTGQQSPREASLCETGCETP